MAKGNEVFEEFVVDDSVDKLGCVISASDSIVKKVTPGGWAESQEIEEGDLLIEVNGKNVNEVTSEELKDAMNSRPFRFRLAKEDELDAAVAIQSVFRGRLGRKKAAEAKAAHAASKPAGKEGGSAVPESLPKAREPESHLDAVATPPESVSDKVTPRARVSESSEISITASERDDGLRSVFDFFDVDRSGALNAKELLDYAKRVGYPGTEDDWIEDFDELCQDLEVNSAQGIPLDRFIQLLNDEEADYYCDDGELMTMLDELRGRGEENMLNERREDRLPPVAEENVVNERQGGSTPLESKPFAAAGKNEDMTSQGKQSSSHLDDDSIANESKNKGSPRERDEHFVDKQEKPTPPKSPLNLLSKEFESPGPAERDSQKNVENERQSDRESHGRVGSQRQAERSPRSDEEEFLDPRGKSSTAVRPAERRSRSDDEELDPRSKSSPAVRQGERSPRRAEDELSPRGTSSTAVSQAGRSPRGGEEELAPRGTSSTAVKPSRRFSRQREETGTTPSIDVIRDVFEICDVDRDRKLNQREMLRFITCLDYPGTPDEWTMEYEALCEFHGWDPAVGINLEGFITLVDDIDDNYYCEAAQMESIIQQLDSQSALAALGHSAASAPGARVPPGFDDVPLKEYAKALDVPVDVKFEGLNFDRLLANEELCGKFKHGISAEMTRILGVDEACIQISLARASAEVNMLVRTQNLEEARRVVKALAESDLDLPDVLTAAVRSVRRIRQAHTTSTGDIEAVSLTVGDPKPPPRGRHTMIEEGLAAVSASSMRAFLEDASSRNASPDSGGDGSFVFSPRDSDTDMLSLSNTRTLSPSRRALFDSSGLGKGHRWPGGRRVEQRQNVHEFKDILLKREQTLACSWRKTLDSHWEGRISIYEFSNACREIGYRGNKRQLWRELDVDHSGSITLSELDWEGAESLGAFHAKLVQRYGSCKAAAKQWNLTGPRRFHLNEFVQLLVPQGIVPLSEAQYLFRMLCTCPHGPSRAVHPAVTLREIEWLSKMGPHLPRPPVDRVSPGKLSQASLTPSTATPGATPGARSRGLSTPGGLTTPGTLATPTPRNWPMTPMTPLTPMTPGGGRDPFFSDDSTRMETEGEGNRSDSESESTSENTVFMKLYSQAMEHHDRRKQMVVDGQYNHAKENPHLYSRAPSDPVIFERLYNDHQENTKKKNAIVQQVLDQEQAERNHGKEPKTSDPESKARLHEPKAKYGKTTMDTASHTSIRRERLWNNLDIRELIEHANERIEELANNEITVSFNPLGAKSRKEIVEFLKKHAEDLPEPRPAVSEHIQTLHDEAAEKAKRLAEKIKCNTAIVQYSEVESWACLMHKNEPHPTCSQCKRYLAIKEGIQPEDARSKNADGMAWTRLYEEGCKTHKEKGRTQEKAFWELLRHADNLGLIHGKDLASAKLSLRELFEKDPRWTTVRGQQRDKLIAKALLLFTEKRQEAEEQGKLYGKRVVENPETFYRLFLDGVTNSMVREDKVRMKVLEEERVLKTTSVHCNGTANPTVFHRLHANTAREKETHLVERRVRREIPEDVSWKIAQAPAVQPKNKTMAQMLLFSFPDAAWPPSKYFESEFRYSLEHIGAPDMSYFNVRLREGNPEGGVTVELRGQDKALEAFHHLRLSDLSVTGARVSEVWTQEAQEDPIGDFIDFITEKFESLEDAFRAFDINHSGTISRSEFLHICSSKGFHGNTTFIWHALDNGMGCLDIQDWMSLQPYVAHKAALFQRPHSLQAMKHVAGERKQRPLVDFAIALGTLFPDIDTAYAHFDTAGHGQLGFPEFQAGARSIGWNGECRSIYQELDVNRRRQIGRREFHKLHDVLMEEQALHNQTHYGAEHHDHHGYQTYTWQKGSHQKAFEPQKGHEAKGGKKGGKSTKGSGRSSPVASTPRSQQMMHTQHMPAAFGKGVGSFETLASSPSRASSPRIGDAEQQRSFGSRKGEQIGSSKGHLGAVEHYGQGKGHPAAGEHYAPARGHLGAGEHYGPGKGQLGFGEYHGPGKGQSARGSASVSNGQGQYWQQPERSSLRQPDKGGGREGKGSSFAGPASHAYREAAWANTAVGNNRDAGWAREAGSPRDAAWGQASAVATGLSPGKGRASTRPSTLEEHGADRKMSRTASMPGKSTPQAEAHPRGAARSMLHRPGEPWREYDEAPPEPPRRAARPLAGSPPSGSARAASAGSIQENARGGSFSSFSSPRATLTRGRSSNALDLTPSIPKLPLDAGDEVVVHRFRKDPALNGEAVKIMRYSSESGAWDCQILTGSQSGMRKMVSADNLLHLEAVEAEGTQHVSRAAQSLLSQRSPPPFMGTGSTEDPRHSSQPQRQASQPRQSAQPRHDVRDTRQSVQPQRQNQIRKSAQPRQDLDLAPSARQSFKDSIVDQSYEVASEHDRRDSRIRAGVFRNPRDEPRSDGGSRREEDRSRRDEPRSDERSRREEDRSRRDEPRSDERSRREEDRSRRDEPRSDERSRREEDRSRRDEPRSEERSRREDDRSRRDEPRPDDRSRREEDRSRRDEPRSEERSRREERSGREGEQGRREGEQSRREDERSRHEVSSPARERGGAAEHSRRESRRGTVDQAPRGDREDRRDRGDRGDRGDRAKRGDRGDRGDRGEHEERGDQGERGERGGRANQEDRGDRGGREERGDQGGRRDRGDRDTASVSASSSREETPKGRRASSSREETPKRKNMQNLQTPSRNDEPNPLSLASSRGSPRQLPSPMASPRASSRGSSRDSSRGSPRESSSEREESPQRSRSSRQYDREPQYDRRDERRKDDAAASSAPPPALSRQSLVERARTSAAGIMAKKRVSDAHPDASWATRPSRQLSGDDFPTSQLSRRLSEIQEEEQSHDSSSPGRSPASPSIPDGPASVNPVGRRPSARGSRFEANDGKESLSEPDKVKEHLLEQQWSKKPSVARASLIVALQGKDP